MTGIPTPRRNVPLRTTTSWKQTPQAATAILISRGPGSRAATSATRKTVRRTGSLGDDGAHTGCAQFAASQPEMIFHLPPSAFMIAPASAPAC